MTSLFEQLLEHMTCKKVGHWTNHEEQAICLDYPGVVGDYRVFAQIFSEGCELHVFAKTKLNPPSGSRAGVISAVTLANRSMAIGDLQWNVQTTEFCFHAAEEITGGELSGEMVDRLIALARSALDNYLRAVLSVIYANESPDAAIRRAE
jgi:hypothetical protein